MPLISMLLLLPTAWAAPPVVGDVESDPAGGVTLYRIDEIEAQIDAVHSSRMQCGPTALWTALRLLGHEASFEAVVQRAPPEADGIRLDRLTETARLYEPRARLVESPAGASIRDLSVPAILVLDERHAVVLAGFSRSGRDAFIIDAGERRAEELLVDEMDARWSGIAIVFEPDAGRGNLLLMIGVLTGVAVLWMLPRLLQTPTSAAAAAENRS